MHTIDTDIPSSLYTRRVILAAVAQSPGVTGRERRAERLRSPQYDNAALIDPICRQPNERDYRNMPCSALACRLIALTSRDRTASRTSVLVIRSDLGPVVEH